MELAWCHIKNYLRLVTSLKTLVYKYSPGKKRTPPWGDKIKWKGKSRNIKISARFKWPWNLWDINSRQTRLIYMIKKIMEFRKKINRKTTNREIRSHIECVYIYTCLQTHTAVWMLKYKKNRSAWSFGQ